MNASPLRRQHGAVTLMGALFLIVVIIVLLNVTQRMAASQIMDSAMQNDAVEALFIAESGLERAAWRVSTGSTCTTLAGETGNIGRGSFQILSATLNGSLCRVRVQGSVTSTLAANTVRRTIEGDFTPGSPPGTAWAVGEKDGGSVTIGNWDGSSWSAASAPALPDEHLNGISCVSNTDCWAVGDDKDGELIIHWDGSSWSRSGPYGGIPNKKLYSVSCVAADDCWATGEKDGGSANLIQWDGTSWSAVSAPSLPDKDLNAVVVVPGGTGGTVQLVQWTEVVQ